MSGGRQDPNLGFQELYEQARQAMPQLHQYGHNFLAELKQKYPGKFDGVVFEQAPIKDERRALDKIKADYFGDQSQIADLVRGRLIVQTPEQIEILRQELNARKGVLGIEKIKDQFAEPLATHFRAINMKVRLPNGHVSEFRVDQRDMVVAADMHRYNDATMFMADIDQLAKDYRCCIIGVRHLTKSNNDDASKRGLGSVGFTARARSVIQVGEAPDDKSQLAMGHAKTNWGEFGRTLVLALEGGGKDAIPKLVWKREADYGVDDINKSNDVGRPSDQPELQLFLKSTLSTKGPMKINDLMSEAVEVGLDCSLRSVQRALGKVATIDGKGPIAKWVLKE